MKKQNQKLQKDNSKQTEEKEEMSVTGPRRSSRIRKLHKARERDLIEKQKKTVYDMRELRHDEKEIIRRILDVNHQSEDLGKVLVAVSIRGQLEEESIEIVKKRFDEERVRILCRLLFFSLNSPRV